MLIILLMSFKIFFYVSFEESKLRNIVVDFCKNYLDKAVKFEDIYVDYFGDMIISNFDLSITSDFNDSLSLLKSEKIILHLSFIELFKKNIKIKNIVLRDSNITIHKQYGKEHNENIKGIITLKKEIKEISYIDPKDFGISLINGEINYKEIFKDKKLTVGCTNVAASFDFKEEKILYEMKGKIIPHKVKGIINGYFNFSGVFNRDNKNYVSHLIIENFDLSYLNDFLNEYKVIENSIKGGVSANLKINSDDTLTSIKGGIDINNLNLLSYLQPQYKIISNKNFNVDLDLNYNKKENIFNISKFKIFDDHLSLDCAGKYSENKKQEEALFSFKTNNIDLYKLSEFFTPFKDINYSGKLLINGELDIDFKNQKINNINTSLAVDNFNSEWFNNGKKEIIFSDSKFKINIDKKNITSSASIKLLQSDFIVNSSTIIKDWYPLKSESFLLINSKTLELEIIFEALNTLINNTYQKAYEDSKRGYEHIYFLQTSLGKTLSNNDINAKYEAGKVKLEGNAKLDNLSFEADFKGGFLTLRDFKLSGYNAQYAVDFSGYFNRDLPFISSKGKVKDFNLDEFSKDLGMGFNLSGAGALEYEFELNAYRMSQLLDNTEAFLNFSISSGLLKNTKFQKKLSAYFEENDLKNYSLNEINFQNFSISITQRGENFFIGNFLLNSENINFNAYGRYNYLEGLDVNLQAMVTDKDRKVTSIPFKISGMLLNPQLTAKNKKDTKKFSLFKID